MSGHQAVRSQTVDLAHRLLVGPLTPDEVLGSPPADTYLTGIIWPEHQPSDPSEDDDAVGVADGRDGEADAGVPGYRAVRPCSIGLTFAIDTAVAVRVSLGQTARYVEDAEGGSADEFRQSHWRRHELRYSVTIGPGPAGSSWLQEWHRPDGSTVRDPAVCLHVKRRTDGSRQVLTLTLVNRSMPQEGQRRDSLCLFQAGLVASATGSDGSGAILPRQTLPPAGGDEDLQSSALLYRDAVELAVGHGIAVEWDRQTGTVRTSWLPSRTVRGTSTRGHLALGDFRTLHPEALRAEWLARDGARAEIIPVLRNFLAVYRQWIAGLADDPVCSDAGFAAAAASNIARCFRAADRIAAGIEALERRDDAWTAFVLANAAMDRQARFEAKKERQGPLVWRPFQLAYILLVIPGLVDAAGDPDRDCVDLLWFPTGGGKTEAYLGLTAFQIFLRRLTADRRRRDGGVDVLMRYTLRLLTVQQFQRGASLICACDALRREYPRLGAAPITIGLFVGQDAVPNGMAEAVESLDKERRGEEPRSTPCQLLGCPVCGSPLTHADYTVTRDETDIEIRCRQERCGTGGHPLPVRTVDETMYRSPPSLLIGTVDKFAQLPRSGKLRSIFGLDGGLPPGLIIQDELHLISGPLGSMTGLYETVIDLLCTSDGVRPKVIGSTATIGQARQQVRALFDRDVLQFPPPGLSAHDSFFAVSDGQEPDRVYLGVSTAGRSPKFALQAVAAAFLQAAQTLREQGADITALDPYWTAVLYFNSLRELGGAHGLMRDDVPRQMEFLKSRLGVSRRPLESEPVELSSRLPSRELPRKLRSLEITLEAADRNPFEGGPEDAVLASNMISVGVDVPRLGLMIVNGQPKSTAEYIQASSRVGRGLPGLVVVLYNASRPRDVSHFEHFIAYHMALYRNVEATSVTPWAPRARDKALHAVLAAAVRHLVPGMDDANGAGRFSPNDPAVAALVDHIIGRADSSSGHVEGAETAADIEKLLREWTQRCAEAAAAGKDLFYWETKTPFGRPPPHLMSSAEEGARRMRQTWPTPNSMREVEPSTAFLLKRIRGS